MHINFIFTVDNIFCKSNNNIHGAYNLIILKKTLKMKTAFFAFTVVCLAELLNTKHFIVKTHDQEDDPYGCENAQHRGTIFACPSRRYIQFIIV
jgi:hypothetical protein